jgi:hypothetical protein
MQTRKRAKSVSFGKKKVEKETAPKEAAPVELEEKPVVVVHSHKVEEETDVTEAYPPKSSKGSKSQDKEDDYEDRHEEHHAPEEEYVSVARREDDDEDDWDDKHDRDRDQDEEDDDEKDEKDKDRDDSVEEYTRDDYDDEEKDKDDKPVRKGDYDESRYDEEGNRIDKDDEEATIEPAEDALSDPFPTVNKDRDEREEDEDEHPKIFGDREDDRYEDDERDDRYHKEDRDSDDDRYVEEDDVQESQSSEPTFKGFSLPPEERRKKRGGPGNAGFFVIVTFLAFLFGLSGIIGFYYISKYQDLNISGMMANFGQEPTPTAEPTEEPTPTEAPVDLEAYTIKVLNGSGVTGLAAKEKTALIDAGFKVGTTGNADNSDYTKTVISVTKKVPEGYVKQLKEQLEKNYSVESSVQTLSDNPEGVDVTVTLGSDGAK